jgi:predicted CXXCH cytochrome family protein
LILTAAVLISCGTVDRVVMAPPSIPNATFVGSKSCEDCHSEITRDFHTAIHARLQAKGTNAINMGCESCHGPGSIHVQTGGASHSIINPLRSPETCFQCHLDKRGEFQLASHHPVLENKVSCSDCHDPHKGPAIKAGGTMIAAENETCFQCHTAQRGPFVFEHEAAREGCTVCHRPHGSVNAKLLSARDANLCLRCHFQEQLTPGKLYIGGKDHTSFLSKGACWTAGCHEAVHGSQIGSSLRF